MRRRDWFWLGLTALFLVAALVAQGVPEFARGSLAALALAFAVLGAAAVIHR